VIEGVGWSQLVILDEVILRPIFVLGHVLIQVDFESDFVELLVLAWLRCFAKQVEQKHDKIFL